MREMLVASREGRDEEGRSHQLDYYLLIGEIGAEGGLCCESYGVRITHRGGDTAEYPHLTTSARRIDTLLERLARNEVAPAGLRDVLEDWL